MQKFSKNWKRGTRAAHWQYIGGLESGDWPEKRGSWPRHIPIPLSNVSAPPSRIWGVGHDFFDELKRGSSVFVLSFSRAFFLCLTMFFLNNLVRVLNKFWNKMGNEIAHLMPIKYKIFLGKGVLPLLLPPPGGQPPGPPQTLFYRLSSPQFEMEWCPCNIIRWLHSRSLVQIVFQRKCKCTKCNTNHLLQLILIEVNALYCIHLLVF